MSEYCLHQSISNAIICVDQSFALKNFGSSFLTLIFDLSWPKWKPSTRRIDSNQPVQLTNTANFCGHLYKQATLWFIRSVPDNLGLNPAECWNALQPSGLLTWHWASQWNDTCTFKSLHLIFFFSNTASGFIALVEFQILIWPSVSLFWSTQHWSQLAHNYSAVA